ncbi:uncharacterized protein LOC142173515 [Nicotiana tabacum]|uniref:Uncharacterized protein LOC142173515 n=1 Tax=Nicotiana tabacum TaxID=4097 RepID=A0AC58TDB9_TOBAC
MKPLSDIDTAYSMLLNYESQCEAQSSTPSFSPETTTFSTSVQKSYLGPATDGILEGDSWIIDSGVTNHMKPNKSLLFNMKPLVIPYLVIPPDGYRVKGHSLKRPLVFGKISNELYLFQADSFLPCISATSVGDVVSTISANYVACPSDSISTNTVNTIEANKTIFTGVHLVPSAFDFDMSCSSVKTLRSDNAFELGSVEDVSFLSSQGIIHQTSCPHTPQQNRVVERKDKQLLETAKSLLFQSKLSVMDKFQSRTITCAFLGYSMTKKAYKLLNLTKHNVIFSRYFIFQESVFPYTNSSPPAFFPSSISTPADYLVSPNVSSPSTSSSGDPFVSLKRSSRPHNPPPYLKDYVCTSVSVSKDSNSTSDACLFEPQFYHQDVYNPAWRAAMLAELQALEANNTWTIVPLPSGKKDISSKWVYKVKQKAYGSIERVPHFEAGLHVLRYLVRTLELGLLFNNSSSFAITGFCDSDWASCSTSRRSVSGFVLLLVGSSISWKSKKPATISFSSTEAENRALRHLVAEIVWMVRILYMFHEHTKHIEIDFHFVHEKLQSSLIDLHGVSTTSQLVDVFTKALPGICHCSFLSKLGLVPHSS